MSCLINPLNFDMLRRTFWTLSKLYFKRAVVNYEDDKKLHDARKDCSKAQEFFERYKELTSKIN